jgi:hypothetical protein
MTECVKQEIIGLTAQLQAYQRLAAKGIYYSIEELAEHDQVVELRTLNLIKRIAADHPFTVDPRDHAEFFETVYWKIAKI